MQIFQKKAQEVIEGFTKKEVIKEGKVITKGEIIKRREDAIIIDQSCAKSFFFFKCFTFC